MQGSGWWDPFLEREALGIMGNSPPSLGGMGSSGFEEGNRLVAQAPPLPSVTSTQHIDSIQGWNDKRKTFEVQ